MRRSKILVVTGIAALTLGACGNDVSTEASTSTSAASDDGSTDSGSTDGTTSDDGVATDVASEDGNSTDDATPDDVDTAGGGDSGRTAEEQAYVDELTAAFEQSEAADQSFPADQMKCFVGDMTDGIGVDNMKEAGLTPEALANDTDADIESLSEGDRKVVADSFTECVDLEQVFTESMAAEGEELPQEMKDCFTDIDWDAMEAEFGEMIISGDDEMAEDGGAMAPLMSCMMGGLGDAMDDLEDLEDELETSATDG